MGEDENSVDHLGADDIFSLHELIVESNADTEAGVSAPGDVDYIAEYVRDGHFGHGPESLHEKAYQLLRLIVANHPFVDGNKRTALMSVRVFYALNGHKFDYGRSVKDILKRLATDEKEVDSDEVVSYLEERVYPLEPEYDATVQLWLSRIDKRDDRSNSASSGDESIEPNDYDDRPPREG